jgi:hypothetical protein
VPAQTRDRQYPNMSMCRRSPTIAGVDVPAQTETDNTRTCRCAGAVQQYPKLSYPTIPEWEFGACRPSDNTRLVIIPSGILGSTESRPQLICGWNYFVVAVNPQVRPRIFTTRSLEILGLRDSSQSGSADTATPSQTFHVHRRIKFWLGSPCERGRFNHEGHVVSGGVPRCLSTSWNLRQS